MMLQGKLCTALILAIVAVHAAPEQVMDEYKVKAAFVFNFAKFVEWPRVFPGETPEPLAICVLGRNPFGQTLAAMVDGKNINGRALALRELSDPREAKSCQIVFVSASERLRYRSIVAQLKGSSVLSVGDTSDFVKEGGVAALWVENGKMQIALNPDRARENNLRVSSKLMSVVRSNSF